MNLSELWREASLYGRVRIVTSDNGSMYCIIAFNTIMHVELEAKSGFGHKAPEDAVSAAIDKAKQIVESIASTSHNIQKLIEAQK